MGTNCSFYVNKISLGKSFNSSVVHSCHGYPAMTFIHADALSLIVYTIGIKYGPEGRVANKAEELMSTRSRRKAPRTG